MMYLSMLKPGQEARIIKLGTVLGPVRRRLMDMGVLPGELVRVEKVAPLGNPIEVIVRGYSLSLRKEEAGGIEVEVPA